MILPLSIAEKLQLLAAGGQLPASSLKHPLVAELLDEGLVNERISGRTKRTCYIADNDKFNRYLLNRWDIPNLADYIQTLKNKEASRADLVAVSNNSKTAAVRTFKGFLVSSYQPIETSLNGLPFTVQPAYGTFQFIYDFGNFVPAPDTVIVGIENPECFAFVEKLRYLLPGINPLFVSRYPQDQGRDLIKWLQSIPNPYQHMGDYDFAGINIYHQEFKKHLGERATFFIPDNMELLLERFGNKSLYDKQQLNAAEVTEPGLITLIGLMHRYKKCLEQEALLIRK